VRILHGVLSGQWPSPEGAAAAVVMLLAAWPARAQSLNTLSASDKAFAGNRSTCGPTVRSR
jgi:hypothetical protein